MCRNILTEEKYKELDNYIEELGQMEGSLISILHKAQHIFGYLPKEVQLYIARKTGIPAARVNGVVTFYSYFTEEPKGEHVISVCLGTACFVRGSQAILKELETKLNIKAGETTGDGKFSIDALRCVGACGLAPVIIIDEKVYGRVKKEELEDILKNYK
jgi:NADH:ubiquinone oxidoreductase subunit E